MMEVMASIATAGGERAGGGHGVPFQRRNVQEWSRLDELTGMLEHARVESNHWAASTSNSSHHFGKVVDSRSRNLADGGLEQRQQTKQLEVFQASIPGGSLQVIRSQSVTSTSSSWHGQSKINTSSHWSSSGNKFLALPSSQNNKEFDNLKLPLNPLDLSSQKSKASVGRSGSIGSRRPPSRPRSIVGLKSDDVVISEGKDNSQISQLSRICQKYHQEAKEAILTNSEAPSLRKHRPLANGHSIYELDANDSTGVTNDNNSFRLTRLLEEKSQSSASEILKSSSESTITNSHQSLASKKSCSIEDLHLSEGGEKMTENGDKNIDWRRSSKVRRSLQFTPKQNSSEKDNQVVSSSISVSKIKQEIEARKQLVSNSLKCNQWNNLGELEGVLGVLRNSAETDNCKTQSNEYKDGKEPTNSIAPSNSPTKKRHTFITVESLKEVRGRLRKLNSPIDDDYSPKIEEVDDGIVTEPKIESPPPEVKSEKLSKSSVKSFVYGMEAAIKNNKQPITGTGSLESRSSNKSNGGTNRSEEWYNRRKSYGFEQVGNQHISQSMSTDKNKVDSSTDSGICRSSETVTYPWSKTVNSDRTFESGKLKTSHNIVIKQAQDDPETNRNKITFEKDNETFVAQKGRKTVVTLGSNYTNNPSWNWNSNNNNNNSNNNNNNNNNTNISNEDGHKEIVRKGKIADALRSLREKSSLFESHRLSEPITISIPIQPVSRTESTDPKSLLLKQTKEPDKDFKKDYLIQSTQITTYSDLIYGKDSKSKEEFRETDTKTIENDNNTNKLVPWNNEKSNSGGNWYGKTEMKRHSIAVDEAKYMNTSKVTGSYYIQDNTKSAENSQAISQNDNHINDFSTHLQNNSVAYPVSYSLDRDSNRLNSENELDNSSSEKKHKKVEFCKTEVHFAAESGRFNIVETDGKPPPSHNFRRRRRSNSETSHNTTGLPEIRFGDSQYEKNLLTGNDKDPETDVNMKTLHYRGSPVFVDAEKDDQVIIAESNATIPSSNSEEDVTMDEENTRSNDPQILVDDEIPKPRSILKNSIPKPRPFFLGEEIPINPKQDLDETKTWGIKLKTSETSQIQTNTAVTANTNNEPKETEFQKLLRSLRPTSHRNTDYPSSLPHVESSSTAEDNGLEVRITSSVPDQRRASWSVADRVRHVEELRTKGYSTKVNFGASETTVIDNKQPQQMRVIAPRQETTDQPFTNYSLISNEEAPIRGAVAPTKQAQTSHHRVLATTVLQGYEPQQSQIQDVETLVSTHSGNPKITSISLRYNNELPLQKQTMITAVHPKPVYNDSVVEHKNYHVSNSTHSVQTNIKQYESGERIWTFSKSDSRPKRDISPEYKKQQVENEMRITAMQTKFTNENDLSDGLKSAKLLLTKSIFPSSESLLNVQNTENGVILHSDNNYRNNNSALSPKYLSTSTSLKSPKYKEIKHEKAQNKDPDYVNVQTDIKSSHSQTDHYESIINSHVVNKVKKDRVVKQEQIKTQDIRKAQNEKSKERKLSTSSSGRDSWLNTPKEPQPRQRNDGQTKRHSHDVKRDKKVTETKTKSTVIKNVKKRSESPIYQNGDVYSDMKESNDKIETDSAILEELRKAADQILLAVNGYTDEESFRGSSDDEYNRRHSKEKIISKPLCTISEMPNKKSTNNIKNSARISHTTVAKSTRSSEIRRDYISSKNKLGKTSSNSSMDSGPVEPRTTLSAEDRSKRRAARLLQRASSRELLLQTAASSSEDIGSGSEAGTLRTKPRVMRRTRTQGTRSSTSTQYTATHLHRNNALPSESRTKERSQRALANSESAVSKSHAVTHPPRKVRAVSEEKSMKQRSLAGTAPTVRCERAERRSLAPPSNSARTSNVLTKKKSNTSQSDESVKMRK